jgi:hypothetical protein
MKRGRRPGANNKGRVASMMLQGFSVGRIAEELGITHASVRRICAQLCICVACGQRRVTNALYLHGIAENLAQDG